MRQTAGDKSAFSNNELGTPALKTSGEPGSSVQSQPVSEAVSSDGLSENKNIVSEAPAHDVVIQPQAEHKEPVGPLRRWFRRLTSWLKKLIRYRG